MRKANHIMSATAQNSAKVGCYHEVKTCTSVEFSNVDFCAVCAFHMRIHIVFKFR